MKKVLLNINSGFLLLVFIYSTFSNSFFHNHEDAHEHHHHHHVESYCEALDSGYNAPFSCSHHSHFEYEEEECFWCDEYNASSYNLSRNYIGYSVPIAEPIYFQSKNNYRFNSFKNLNNKGPPILYT